MGHQKSLEAWNVLIRDHHQGYIPWEQFEANQKMLNENAHMQQRTARKSARGGRALLTGMVRCGRCGRMMRVFYGMRSGHAHRYQCRGEVQGEHKGMCVGVGGVRVDRAVAAQILESVAGHVIDEKEDAKEVVVTIHWTGGRHTELRITRVRCGRYPEDRHPSPVEVIRNLGGQWPDRELAVTMNRMRCRSAEGTTWTAVRVRELRERMGIAPFDPTQPREATISVDETARRLKICVGSVLRLIRERILPAEQLMPSAPWQVPVAALDTEALKLGVRAVIERRPRNSEVYQDERTLKLPGFQ